MVKLWKIDPEERTAEPFKFRGDLTFTETKQIADAICVDIWGLYQTRVFDGMMYHAHEPHDPRGFRVGTHTFRGLSIFCGEKLPKMEWLDK